MEILMLVHGSFVEPPRKTKNPMKIFESTDRSSRLYLVKKSNEICTQQTS